MIVYQSGGFRFLSNIFRMDGSVFPKAVTISLPSAVLSAAVVFALHRTQLFDGWKSTFEVMKDSTAWSGFSFLVGFLIVFRTSQAYQRFWEGCTSTNKMGARWFDACCNLVSFSRMTAASEEDVVKFRNILVRLFSMLHAAAFGEIEQCSEGHGSDVAKAFQMELLYPEGIDQESLAAVRDSNLKVELIFQWLQMIVTDAVSSEVLTVPAPILSRAFQELSLGLVHFHEAMTIADVPFPFPYAQTCDSILVIHWFLVPFAVTVWVEHVGWAAVFAFVQVFMLWTLNLIAVELENPFGTDPNDIDGGRRQIVMNNALQNLLKASSLRVPTLSEEAASVVGGIVSQRSSCITGTPKSFRDCWESIPVASIAIGEELRPAMPSRRLTLSQMSRRSRTSGRSTHSGWSEPMSSEGLETDSEQSLHMTFSVTKSVSNGISSLSSSRARQARGSSTKMRGSIDNEVNADDVHLQTHGSPGSVKFASKDDIQVIVEGYESSVPYDEIHI